MISVAGIESVRQVCFNGLAGIVENVKHHQSPALPAHDFYHGRRHQRKMRQFLESEKVPGVTKPFALPELHAAIRTVLKRA